MPLPDTLIGCVHLVLIGVLVGLGWQISAGVAKAIAGLLAK